MYERGQRDPDTDTVKFLAKYFDVSTDWLLGLSETRNPFTENESVSPEKKYGFATKAYHNLDVGGLSDEDISKVEEYIGLLKQKYNPDGTLKKKD
jgi:transcriptional regulator with XRE-family HTH domain